MVKEHVIAPIFMLNRQFCKTGAEHWFGGSFMKTVVRAAEVACWFDSSRNIYLVKFKTNKSEGTKTTVKINKEIF